jgi:hypothetical protein
MEVLSKIMLGIGRWAMKNVVWVEMTPGQQEDLEPLVDAAREARAEGMSGAILGQPDYQVEKPTRFKFRFVDGETVEMIRAVMVERGYLPEGE